MIYEPIDFKYEGEAELGGRPVQRCGSRAMGTTFEISLADQSREFAEQACWEAFTELRRLEEHLSRFIPHSDIARFNRQPLGEPLLVGPPTIECLACACDMYYRTEGAFDVSLGGGLEKMEIYPAEHTLVRRGEISLDLGGIGKGYAVDGLVRFLQEFWQVESALVQGGWSSFFGFDRTTAAAGWPVELTGPVKSGKNPPTGPVGAVSLQGESLSSSSVLLEGPHILDPRTHAPAGEKLAAWALAPTAAAADALSTAFFVMTPAEIENYCRQYPEVAGMIARTNENKIDYQTFGKWCPPPRE